MTPVIRRVLGGIVTLGFISSGAVSLQAQDAAVEAAPADSAPADAADTASEISETDSPDNPLVVEPKTPEEIFDAVLLMVDISRIEVARGYLKKFLAEEPTDEVLIQLREKYGPGAFLRLANIKELRPESQTLLERNNTAYRQYANDPARLDSFLKGLVSDDVEQRTIARHQMETAGTAVVPALVAALGDPKYASFKGTIVEMLVRIGRPATPALHAALASPDSPTRQSVILALGLIRDEASIPHLIRFAGQPEASAESEAAKKAITRIVGNDSAARAQLQGAASRLVKTARDYYLGRNTGRIGSDQLVTTWVWDESARTVRELRLPPATAAIQQGIFFADAALDVAPERLDVQTTYLNLLFAQEAATVGFNKPIASGPGSVQDIAASVGLAAVNRALADALEWHKLDSALVALQVLARIGNVQQIRSVGGQQSPLLRALNFPSRRVQFAAAETIIALDPAMKYAGSERVIAILGRALTQAETTMKQGMVLDSVINRGQSIAGFLRELGFEINHRQTGKEGFRTAASLQEVDLILLDANIQRWGLSETLTNLKYDPRTKDIPIVIYGEAVTERTIRVYMKQFPNVHYIEVPASAEDLERQLEPILSQQAELPLTADERSTKSSRAAELLSFLSNGQRRKLYDFTLIEKPVLNSLQNAQLAAQLLPVVNAIPSIASQTQLAEFAADPAQTNQVRSVASRQLVSHLQLYGLLITKEHVTQLRAAWQETTQPALHAELSAVMGVLQPNAALIGQRLKRSGAARAPAPSTPAPDTTKPAESADPASAPATDGANS